MNDLPTIDMIATGANITAMRQRAGLSVRDLQDIFGFSTPQAIYKWQRGDAMPTLDNIVALAAIFGVTVDDILVYREQSRLLISAKKMKSARQRAEHGAIVELAKTPALQAGDSGFDPRWHHQYAVVAQLVERLLAMQEVAGSSPVNRSIRCHSRIG